MQPMAKKEDTYFPLPGDTSGSFDREDSLLNFRPTIGYVEPDQVTEDYPIRTEDQKDPPTLLEDTRIRTQNVIDGLKSVVALIDIAQARVDQRVNASVAGLGMPSKISAGTTAGTTGGEITTAAGAGVGPGITGGAGSGEVATTGPITSGVSVKLDPVKDAHVISAMKRRFPEKVDPTVITYEDYKQVIDCVHKHAPDVPAISVTDIRAATADPQRTAFGGYNNRQGQNRPEISSVANSVEPIDLEAFQYGAILALFALLYPLIKMEDKLEIVQHLVTVPHI
jgi:hypothetical protein